MTTLGWAHTATAVVALASGAAVLVAAKGTMRHRQLGWIYAASMLGLNGTALFIYRLFGGFGPFHAFAIVSLVGVLCGTASGIMVRRHRRARELDARARAIEYHYAWMTWSYVGLVAAALSEVATRLPIFRPQPGTGIGFGIGVALATLLVVVIGARLIRTRRAQLLAPYRHGREKPPLVPAA